MKKLLLIGLILLEIKAFSQQSTSTSSAPKLQAPALKNKQSVRKITPSERGGYIPYNNNASRKLISPASANSVQSFGATEDIIGNTLYDIQAIGSTNGSLVHNADSTMSSVWTFSPDITSGFPNRGTGYNFFDKSSWGSIPSSRIEEGEGSFRTGHPAVTVTSTGKEIVVAHGVPVAGSNLGMVMSSRSTAGTGPWFTTDTALGNTLADSVDLFPKIVTAGANGQTIHAIWSGGGGAYPVDGQRGPIFYSRSTDNGVTWPVLESILTPIDFNNYYGFSEDNYSIDARDSVVAIVAGGFMTDIVLLKSTDNGNTWSKTTVASFAIPNYNPSTMTTDTNSLNPSEVDTLVSCAGDPNVVIDNNGIAHVFFSVVRVIQRYPSTDSIFYFPYTDGLEYWNETEGPVAPSIIAQAPRLNGETTSAYSPLPSNSGSFDFCGPNGDDWGFGLYDAGITEKPSPGVDANNNIYVCYQTIDENSDTISGFGKDFKHIYLIKSSDNGNTWTNSDSALDVVKATQPTQNSALEGVYGCMARHVDSKIRITYQRDGIPGLFAIALSVCDQQNNSTDPANVNNIVYAEIDTDITTVGIHELSNKAYGVVLSPNFPNPATESTQFNVTLSAAVNVQLNVTDMLGQNVYSENKGMLSGGTHLVTLNTAYLSSGVYFYSVTAGTEKVTGKMIVE